MGADADCLRRCLRFMSLCEHPLLRVDRQQRYTLTWRGRHFCTAHPQSCRTVALSRQGPVLSRARSQAYTAIVTGTPGYRLAFGEHFKSMWEVMADEDAKSGTAELGR